MQVNLRNVCFALFALAIVSTSGYAQSQEDKTLAPYFFVQGDPSIDRLPLKDTRVEISISGVIADVKVVQTYRNEGVRPINASYVFPASTRAAVYAMRMRLGDEVIVAKIKEKEIAKKEFEEAKKEGKSASLLEQDRPNVFSMHLANVMPQEQVEIELHYTELLVPTSGTYEFVFPTVVGPRYPSPKDSRAKSEDGFVNTPYLHQGEKPTSTLHISAKIAAGVPIQEISCPSHQVFPQFQNPSVAQLTMDDSDPFQGNRDFVLHYRLIGAQITSGVLLFQGEDENYFLYMAQPPARVATEEIPPREYIFVVDVSGSMNGYPLDTAKKLMSDLANVLRPSDTFNIVVFADGSATFSPVSVPATRPNLTRALQFIGQKNGGGGTRLLAALERAVAIPRQREASRSIVLVTDGYIEAEADVFDYVRAQRNAVNVFAFGIGSSVNRFLIEGIARAGLGEPFIVTEPGEAAEAAARLRRYIDTPVLTGIDVTFNGFDAYDVEPGTVPDLFASRPIIVFGKWRGRAAGSIDISGRTGRGVYRTSVAVSPSSADIRHSALRHLWARTRIADLSDFGPSALSEERVAEITSLGLSYGLLTRYTSFVAVQEVVRRTTEDADDVDQPLPLPAGVSDLAVGVTAGPEPEIVWVYAIVLSMLGGVSLLRRRRPSTVTQGAPSDIEGRS